MSLRADTRFKDRLIGDHQAPMSEAARIKSSYVTGCEPSHSVLLLSEPGRRRYGVLVETLKEANPARVLDLGCGEGILEGQLIHHGLSFELLVGVDLNRQKLLETKLLSSTQQRIELLQADVENLPLRPGSFDAIVASEVIEHVPNEAVCLSELRRLAPRQVIITVPALRYPGFLLAIGSERFETWFGDNFHFPPRLGGLVKAFLWGSKALALPFFLLMGILKTGNLQFYDYRLYHGRVPHRLYTAQYLVNSLKQHGFAVLAVRGIGFSLPFVAELEILLRKGGMTYLARVLARLQSTLDACFKREANSSENILISCVGTANY